ncbi:DUF1684 domain-containing protein [Herbiconiux moechotypicola]|uniref:DUF1684 domain-containing protein n=1 Tax=Herbiconiux moechotypicola TaxID=637393 RepID=A0ABN3DNA6_9MICO|nr:DUF1684 domain-containing protein [Herbiconiux moechotypicola]MCS5730361.1 DUF1684 domain-containing protein [Herbiconiux moechotypicola]
MTTPLSTLPTEPATAFTADWQAWHDELERSRRDPHGFLAYSSITLLDGTPRAIDGAPGLWSTGPDGPRVDLPEGETIELDGITITGAHGFGPLEERQRRRATWRDAVLELSRRGGHDLLRPVHPESPRRTGYLGTPTFEPDPRWVVEGLFVPWDEPRDLSIDAAVDGIVHTHTSPGVVEFTIDGVELSLVVFEGGPTPGSLFTVFTDATSGVSTYPASRALHGFEVGDDSRVVLDFTRTSNLQCAYTPYSPCPLAPAQNRLPVAIEAGERTPHGDPRAADD